jgi:hypothetical protein
MLMTAMNEYDRVVPGPSPVPKEDLHAVTGKEEILVRNS